MPAHRGSWLQTPCLRQGPRRPPTASASVWDSLWGKAACPAPSPPARCPGASAYRGCRHPWAPWRAFYPAPPRPRTLRQPPRAPLAPAYQVYRAPWEASAPQAPTAYWAPSAVGTSQSAGRRRHQEVCWARRPRWAASALGSWVWAPASRGCRGCLWCHRARWEAWRQEAESASSGAAGVTRDQWGAEWGGAARRSPSDRRADRSRTEALVSIWGSVAVQRLWTFNRQISRT